jgi:hypothetical protein
MLGPSVDYWRLGARPLTARQISTWPSFHALARSAKRVVDKMSGNFLYLGLVGLMLPRARIIHCVRDPRDIGLSIFTLRFHGAHGYARDLADLGWCIGAHDRLMAHWRCALPNPVVTVRLDDWIRDFDPKLPQRRAPMHRIARSAA